jgi:RHS repeat-associated protein
MGEYGMGGSASSGSTQHIYLPTAAGSLPVAAVINGQHYAVHADHLNTPRRLTGSNNQVVWQWAFSAFGQEPPTTPDKRFTNASTKPSTGTTTAAAVTYNLRYPGQVYDAESKLHYNYHRTYDPQTGRYTQPDPIGLDGGWNRYSYVEGNPLSFVDPDGLQQRAPPPRPNPNLISNVQANNLITQIQQINPQFRYPSVVSAPGQGGYSSQDVQFLQTALQRVRPGGRLWPRTPQEMEQYLGTPGICRPDLPGTPGRAKIIWQPSDNVRITFEQHPYHPTAPSFHSGPHWHLDLPGVRHRTYVPTEPMP